MKENDYKSVSTINLKDENLNVKLKKKNQMCYKSINKSFVRF